MLTRLPTHLFTALDEEYVEAEVGPTGTAGVVGTKGWAVGYDDWLQAGRGATGGGVGLGCEDAGMLAVDAGFGPNDVSATSARARLKPIPQQQTR